METLQSSLLLSFLFVLLFPISSASSAHKINHEKFAQCLSLHGRSTSISKVIYTRADSNYTSVLLSEAQNLRFTLPSVPKPLVIVTPVHESQIQATVTCAKEHGLQVRVRSGGHDYEGLSYVSSQAPFVVVDLINLRAINIDTNEKTAWIQTGATLGEFYYAIANASSNLAFPAGFCPSVGSGGHISGGGYGPLLRKYGLAADQVIDARLIDVNGRILDRKTMGEDLFWAIRGGGGASFGVILAWKMNLVSVPSNVTVFTVSKNLEQNATKILYKWQDIAHRLHEDLFIMPVINRVNNSVQISFTSIFLGGSDRLLSLMGERFPELGLTKEDCLEMSWIQSILYFNRFGGLSTNQSLISNQPLDLLLNRTSLSRQYFKGKSDYVKEPISEKALEGLWKMFLEREAKMAQFILVPYGGKMSKISESSIPFPHRAGNLYKIQYTIFWDEATKAKQYIDWIRRVYRYMTPYVSKSPRAAYINYRDLDIGMNKKGFTSYKQASIWGIKYFNNNFKRLAHVKTMVDPANFFKNEQSIPTITAWGENIDD